MQTLSLAMIVKNEEEVLARCLDCVAHIVDEIVIVDTGSTDKTKEIAAKYTDKIYDFEWINDFSAARNFAFSKATSDYIMWLDADDVISEADQEKLLELKHSLDGTVDLFMLRYHVAFDTEGNVTFTNNRERIVKRTSGFKWVEPVHEVIQPFGNIVRSDVAITHGEKHRTHSTRNLDIYEAQETLSPRGMYYFARELHTHGKFEKAIEYFTKFLESGRGWTEDCVNACYSLAELYKILGKREERHKILLKSIEFGELRPKTCYYLGEYFLESHDLEKAKLWYELAYKTPKPVNDGFYEPDYASFFPYLQLGVVYFRLGDVEKAYDYHLKSEALKPQHPSVLFNKKYFTENHSDLVKKYS